MNQLSIFAPYVHHSSTSKAAAESLKSSKVDQDRDLLVRALTFNAPAGLTDDALQLITGLSGDSERPRRISLLKDGLILDSGRKERTRSGKLAVVWVVA